MQISWGGRGFRGSEVGRLKVGGLLPIWPPELATRNPLDGTKYIRQTHLARNGLFLWHL